MTVISIPQNMTASISVRSFRNVLPLRGIITWRIVYNYCVNVIKFNRILQNRGGEEKIEIYSIQISFHHFYMVLGIYENIFSLPFAFDLNKSIVEEAECARR